MAPREKPNPPPVPESMTTGELLNWYEAWIEEYRAAFEQAEADKAALRDWVKKTKEVGRYVLIRWEAPWQGSFASRRR